jgi:hypothetical protein
VLQEGAGGLAAAVANSFCRVYLSEPGYALLEGKNRRQLSPYLSRTFLSNLDKASACERDWIRQQPKGSTDKPPFVDCCLFSSSNDWFPNVYTIEPARPLEDGRYEVPIEYRYRTSTEDHRWRVAVIVKREDGRYVVDDFVGDFDAPPRKPWTLSKDWEGCRDGKWVD